MEQPIAKTSASGSDYIVPGSRHVSPRAASPTRASCAPPANAETDGPTSHCPKLPHIRQRGWRRAQRGAFTTNRSRAPLTEAFLTSPRPDRKSAPRPETHRTGAKRLVTGSSLQSVARDFGREPRASRARLILPFLAAPTSLRVRSRAEAVDRSPLLPEARLLRPA